MNQSLFRYLIVLFFLFSFSIEAQESVSKNCIVFSHNTIDTQAIKQCCDDTILVENVTFESDIVFDQEEFLHVYSPG